MTAQLVRSQPDAGVVAIDIDLEVLEIADANIREQDLMVDLQEGSASELPFDDEHFDVATSRLVVHHLTPSVKDQAFTEIYRVLKPAGCPLVADWGEPEGCLTRAAFLSVQLLDGFETTENNRQGKPVPMMEDAGFREVSEVVRRRTLLGVLALDTGTKIG